jgi:hypothetical protein
LTHSNGSHQVHDPSAVVGRIKLKVDLGVWKEGCQVLEENLALRDLGLVVVDLEDLEQGKIALSSGRSAYLTVDGVSCLEVVAPQLTGREVDVVRAWQIVVDR